MTLPLPVPLMPVRLSRLLAALLLVSGVRVAGAQVPTDTVPTDTVPRNVVVNPMLLSPSRFVYQMRLVRDSVSRIDSVRVDSVQLDTIIKTDTIYRPLTVWHVDTVQTPDSTSMFVGERSVSVVDAMYQNAPSWLLLETRSTDRGYSADSLLVRRTDLHPLHWGATLSGSRLSAEFVGDTALFGATSGPTGRRSVVATVPAGTMVSAAMLETYLRLFSYWPGWRDSTLSLSVTLGSDLLLPTELSVIGEQAVTVPAGTFDCWVIDARAGRASTRYWISKQDPTVVLSIVPLPNDTRARLVTELTLASH